MLRETYKYSNSVMMKIDKYLTNITIMSLQQNCKKIACKFQ